MKCDHGRLRPIQQQADETIERLRAEGLRITPQRRAIVLEVVRAQGHISPTMLAQRITAQIPGVNASTVYRTLATLERMRILSHTHQESGVQYHRAGEGNHVHLVCSSCGAEESLPLAEVRSLERLLRRNHGFRPDLSHFALGTVRRVPVR